MRKIISVILAITLLLTFASCGSTSDSKSSKKDSSRNEVSDKMGSSFKDFLESVKENSEEEITNIPEGESHNQNTGESYQEKPEIISATTLTGTVLTSSNTDSSRTFVSGNTLDKNIDTSWCVNTDNNGGVGAQIRFDLKEKTLVKGFMMVNGNLYQPEKGIFRSNGQVQRFTLTFSDGTSLCYTAEYNDTASAQYESFEFVAPVVTDYIILTVDSAYVGQKYTTNVAISEVAVF